MSDVQVLVAIVYGVVVELPTDVYDDIEDDGGMSSGYPEEEDLDAFNEYLEKHRVSTGKTADVKPICISQFFGSDRRAGDRGTLYVLEHLPSRKSAFELSSGSVGHTKITSLDHPGDDVDAEIRKLLKAMKMKEETPGWIVCGQCSNFN